MVHFFKLNGDYTCSAMDMERLQSICEEVTIEEVKKKIKEVLHKDVEVRVSWTYNGFRLFIMEKLSKQEVDAFVYSLDPLRQIGTCSLFWELEDNRNCTGILLGYDFIHYYRIITGAESFIVLANNGLEEYVDRLREKYVAINPLLEFVCEKDKVYEKKVLGDKLKGYDYKADVVIDGNKSSSREGLSGRMHVGERTGRTAQFDDYWQKKNSRR